MADRPIYLSRTDRLAASVAYLEQDFTQVIEDLGDKFSDMVVAMTIVDGKFTMFVGDHEVSTHSDNPHVAISNYLRLKALPQTV